MRYIFDKNPKHFEVTRPSSFLLPQSKIRTIHIALHLSHPTKLSAAIHREKEKDRNSTRTMLLPNFREFIVPFDSGGPDLVFDWFVDVLFSVWFDDEEASEFEAGVEMLCLELVVDTLRYEVYDWVIGEVFEGFVYFGIFEVRTEKLLT